QFCRASLEVYRSQVYPKQWAHCIGKNHHPSASPARYVQRSCFARAWLLVATEPGGRDCASTNANAACQSLPRVHFIAHSAELPDSCRKKIRKGMVKLGPSPWAGVPRVRPS
ncbi:MAG: hypothetical protein ACTHOU_14125, partial [Aureliella sp.]